MSSSGLMVLVLLGLCALGGVVIIGGGFGLVYYLVKRQGSAAQPLTVHDQPAQALSVLVADSQALASVSSAGETDLLASSDADVPVAGKEQLPWQEGAPRPADPSAIYRTQQPSPETLARWKAQFASRALLTLSERRIYDNLLVWVNDQVNLRYGDRFVLNTKIPAKFMVRSTGDVPNVLSRALATEMDFIICTRGDRVAPVVAIKIWSGSVGRSSSANYYLPENEVKSRPLTPQEWEEWIAVGVLQVAGIRAYLVTEQMALAWNEIGHDFLRQLEADLGESLANTDVLSV